MSDMKCYPLQRLGELVSGNRGVSYKPENLKTAIDDNSVVLLRSNNIQSGTLNFENVQIVPDSLVSDSQILKKGDIAVCMSNGSRQLVGKSGMLQHEIEYPLTVGAFCSVFRCQNEDDSEYVRYLFQSQAYQHGIDVALAGSAINNLKNSDVEAIEVPTAPKELRKKIAEILATIDNQIDATQALIDKYTAIKQGMMADLFSRGIDPETKALRPTFEEAPELYHETPLGMLPKGWNVDTLSKLAEKITDGDHHTPERSSEGRYLLSARNIHDGYLDFSKVDYVPEYEYQRMIKRCFPEAGDIFISCSGSIGRVCEVPENFSCALVRSVALVKLDNNLVQSSYICWWLRTEKMQKAMINSALQAAQPNLFQGAIEQLDVVLCAPEEQLLISKRLNVIENMMLLNKSDLKKLKVQKAGLMQDLLTGKVSVPA